MDILWQPYFMLTNLHWKLWTVIFINDILWCAKWMFHERHMICFGVQNVCLHVLCCMPCCTKCMLVCTMKYALVCKINVCLYYEICFGVLSWICQHNCLGIATRTNCLNCNWKQALVLTLLNTKAQKFEPCINTLVYSSSRCPLLSLASPATVYLLANTTELHIGNGDALWPMRMIQVREEWEQALQGPTK